jgi:hypothetical protein
MKGVLFWVTLVGAAAARQGPDWPFLMALVVRLMFEMCYNNWCWAAAISPVKRFTWLQVTCESGSIANFASSDTQAAFIKGGRPNFVTDGLGGLTPFVGDLGPDLHSPPLLGPWTGRQLAMYPTLGQERPNWISERCLETQDEQ